MPTKLNKEVILKVLGTLLTVILLGAMFYWRATQNFNAKNQHPDDHRSNFFTFWLAGHMVLNGEDPYNEAQYLAGHDEFNVNWRPNKIFPYPLPLSLLMIPLGALPLSTAYFALQYITQIIIAVTMYALLSRWQDPAYTRLLVPLMAFFLFFSPVLLTLQVGSVGALALLIMLISMLLLEKEKSLAAGVVLSLTILKPPQGLTILLLAGIWLFARKDWKVIQGIIYGGLGILIVGMIQNPLWVIQFGKASQAVMDRTQGIQSNVWAYAYIACDGASPCATLLGGFGALILLGLGGFFLWRNHARLTAWDAFNIIIPIGFVSTVYLWVYDQILYIIPIVWIVGSLIERRKSYIFAFIFLIVLAVAASSAMIHQAYTLEDTWNIGTSIVVLVMVLWLYYLNQIFPIEKDIPNLEGKQP